jgi:hypothetical protein
MIAQKARAFLKLQNFDMQQQLDKLYELLN